MLILLLALGCSVDAAADPPAPARVVEGEILCMVEGVVVADGPADVAIDSDVWEIVADGYTVFAPREACSLTIAP